jgi:hypothetical protein
MAFFEKAGWNGSYEKRARMTALHKGTDDRFT